MIIPDINLLLYAYNPFAPQHGAALTWWEETLNGEELIGLPHEVAFGFLRIATHPRTGTAAVPLQQARDVVAGWLTLPNLRVLAPAPDHIIQVMDLLAAARASGAIVSDAVLAVYAISHRAVLHTNDADFSRFPGLQWRNPLSPP